MSIFLKDSVLSVNVFIMGRFGKNLKKTLCLVEDRPDMYTGGLQKPH